MQKLIIGWREWAELPSLKIPAIKVKIDTGARTSSLHAFRIKGVKVNGKKYVKFMVQPLQKRKDVLISCRSPVHDRRYIRDSGGRKEFRYIIKVPFSINGVSTEVEISLTNRSKMSFRMLLGRTAMIDIAIEPKKSFLLGRMNREMLEKLYGVNKE